MLETITTEVLTTVTGGAADTMGPTALVNGHPLTQQALEYRRDRLFEHANDPKMSNDQFLRTYKRLNDAYMRLPYLR